MSTTAIEPEVKRPVPAWRRLLVAAGWFALLVVAVSAGGFVFSGQQSNRALDEVIDELNDSDPGWRWPTPLVDRPEVPPAENSGPRILAVARDVPRGWPELNKWEKIQDLPPNVMPVGPLRATLDDLLTAAPVPTLRPRARDLLRFPQGRIEVTLLENPWAITFPDHDRLFRVQALLSLDALDLALAGRPGEALRSARACLNVARALEDDPFLLGQSFHTQFAGAALASAERVMALGDAPDDELAAFQKDLQREAGGVRATAALRGARAMTDRTLTLLSSGKVTLSEVERLYSYHPVEWWQRLGWISALTGRQLARREHAGNLRLLTKMVEATRLPVKDQFAAEDDIEKELSETKPSLQFVPPIRVVNDRARKLQCQAVALRALIAVERYRLKHGKWPAKLEDTVPEFLDKVPEDPIDGSPIRYKKWAEGVVVYSIGNDRTDDGGDVGRSKDFGYRLSDREKRRAAPP